MLLPLMVSVPEKWLTIASPDVSTVLLTMFIDPAPLLRMHLPFVDFTVEPKVTDIFPVEVL
jgi:hypothetical protein